jgi:hypothetical protein
MARRNKNQADSHPDLFSNNADIILNQLLAAFRAQNGSETERLIQRLSKEHPTHSRLPNLRKLLEAQKKLKMPVTDILYELNEMQTTICPLAFKSLGARAPIYLGPLWQRLALALKGQNFNPETPKLHCSFVYSELRDWLSVRQAVENEADWHQYPSLVFRLTKALYFLNELESSLEIWFYFFWQFPAKAQTWIDKPENPNLALQKRWRVFEDLELNPVSFPTWMLLTDSKLIHYSLKSNIHTLTPHSKNYQTIQQLLFIKSEPAKNTQPVELELRKALKQLDGNLLKWYLKSQGG